MLLAPACSSFDWFRDYAERGETFKREVALLKEKRGGKREGDGDKGTKTISTTKVTKNTK